MLATHHNAQLEGEYMDRLLNSPSYGAEAVDPWLRVTYEELLLPHGSIQPWAVAAMFTKQPPALILGHM